MNPHPTMPILRVFISVPAVRVANGDHDSQNIEPCFRIEHHGICEHAAVPADVLECTRDLAAIVAHPGAGVAYDVELPVRVARQAMSAGLVMRSCALNGADVLSNVEVDGPGSKGARH